MTIEKNTTGDKCQIYFFIIQILVIATVSLHIQNNLRENVRYQLSNKTIFKYIGAVL